MKELALLPTRELREELNTAYNEAHSIATEVQAGENFRKDIASPLFVFGVIIMSFVCVFGSVASIAGIVGTVIFLLEEGAKSAKDFGEVAIVVVILLITVFCISKFIKLLKKRFRANRAAALSSDEKLAQLLEATVALPNIPVDYCNDLALGFMVERIDKGVAATWKDCVEQYEQQVHRWTMEQNSAEAAHYAKSAARSAAWAAIGAWR